MKCRGKGVDIIGKIEKVPTEIEMEKRTLLVMNKHMMEKGLITYEIYLKIKAKIEKMS
jgi:hypothetical protein